MAHKASKKDQRVFFVAKAVLHPLLHCNIKHYKYELVKRHKHNLRFMNRRINPATLRLSQQAMIEPRRAEMRQRGEIRSLFVFSFCPI